jgi:hypothetical protein
VFHESFSKSLRIFFEFFKVCDVNFIEGFVLIPILQQGDVSMNIALYKIFF